MKGKKNKTKGKIKVITDDRARATIHQHQRERFMKYYFTNPTADKDAFMMISEHEHHSSRACHSSDYAPTAPTSYTLCPSAPSVASAQFNPRFISPIPLTPGRYAEFEHDEYLQELRGIYKEKSDKTSRPKSPSKSKGKHSKSTNKTSGSSSSRRAKKPKRKHTRTRIDSITSKVDSYNADYDFLYNRRRSSGKKKKAEQHQQKRKKKEKQKQRALQQRILSMKKSFPGQAPEGQGQGPGKNKGRARDRTAVEWKAPFAFEYLNRDGSVVGSRKHGHQNITNDNHNSNNNNDKNNDNSGKGNRARDFDPHDTNWLPLASHGSDVTVSASSTSLLPSQSSLSPLPSLLPSSSSSLPHPPSSSTFLTQSMSAGDGEYADEGVDNHASLSVVPSSPPASLSSSRTFSRTSRLLQSKGSKARMASAKGRSSKSSHTRGKQRGAGHGGKKGVGAGAGAGVGGLLTARGRYYTSLYNEYLKLQQGYEDTLISTDSNGSKAKRKDQKHARKKKKKKKKPSQFDSLGLMIVSVDSDALEAAKLHSQDEGLFSSPATPAKHKKKDRKASRKKSQKRSRSRKSSAVHASSGEQRRTLSIRPKQYSSTFVHKTLQRNRELYDDNTHLHQVLDLHQENLDSLESIHAHINREWVGTCV